MKNIHFLFVALVCCLVSACGQTIPTQNKQSVMINSCDSTVTIGKNGSATVRLPLISGTGYAWHLVEQSNAALIEKVSDEVLITPLDKSDMDGNTEIQTFNLKTTKNTGTDVLTFHYKRIFEKNKPPLKVCTVTIIVK